MAEPSTSLDHARGMTAWTGATASKDLDLLMLDHHDSTARQAYAVAAPLVQPDAGAGRIEGKGGDGGIELLA